MPGQTVTGYELTDNLKLRLAAARAEQAAGRNPRALLFPAPRGGHWSASNFDSRVWIPAMDAAGVPFVEWDELVKTGAKKGQPATRRAYRYTCHSLRDRFAISALNVWAWQLDELRVTGGWKDANVIFKRYYGVAKGVLGGLRERTGRGVG